MSNRLLLPVPLRLVLAVALALFSIGLAIAPAVGRFESGGFADPQALADEPVGYLLLSEAMTGGASASDEFVELYNPASVALPLEGLELIYVSASGATITRKAAWSVGAPAIPAGAHYLIANDAGVFAGIADVTYANGLAAAGGSVALRIQGASTAIDALGWGTAASTWLEGTPAPAPAASSSLERLPGGANGSGQDTNSNVVDFVVRALPDPQNAAAPPIVPPTPSPTASTTSSPSPSVTPTPSVSASPSPSASVSSSPTPSETPSPSPSATPSPTPSPTPVPTPSPTPSPITIAEARALPDGSQATIEGVALMSSDFTDGGGCVTDGAAGIALLVDGATFARGATLRAGGTVDDRYAQRTLRVSADGLSVTGTGQEETAQQLVTGGVGEANECRLVQIAGKVAGLPTALASGLAFELDDGSGPLRVLVAPASGIDTTQWVRDATVSLIGVSSQRDSSGTGTAGYRVLPRAPDDILSITPPPSPTPSASPTLSPGPTSSTSVTPSARPSATPQPSATDTPGPALITIAQARAAAVGTTVRIRGVVTMPSGVVDAPTAIIQDGSGAIVLRLGDEAGKLRRGRFIEAVGVRSTKAGMLTVRVDRQPKDLGAQAEPTPRRIPTSGAGEALEAQLVITRGAVTTTPVKSTAGNLAFSVDDGSGPLRVTLFADSNAAGVAITKGSWIEIRGVLGQQTTGQQPERGYRLWPRDRGDITVISPAGAAVSTAGGSSGASSGADAGGTSGGVLSGVGLPGEAEGGAAGAAGGQADGAGSAAGLSSDGADAVIGGATPGFSLLSATGLDRRLAALLLGSVALLVLMGTMAWRYGTLDRLRAALGLRGEPALAAVSEAEVSPHTTW